MRRRIPLLKRVVPSVRRRLWRLSHSDGYGVVESQGARFRLNPENFVDRQIIFYDDYENAQLAALTNRMTEMGCEAFLDIGAAFGYYSIVLAGRFPALAVDAFEPDPRNAAQLRANLALNRLDDRVTLHEAAASAAPGRIAFRPGPAGSTGQSAVDESGPLGVAAVTIDASTSFDQRPIAAKIDVEGHELAVLHGMHRTLTRNRCLLQIETYREQIPLVIDHLAGLGYALAERIEHDHVFVKVARDTGSRARTEP